MNAFTIPKSTFAQQLQSNRSKGKTPTKEQSTFYIAPALSLGDREFKAEFFTGCRAPNPKKRK